MFQQYSARPWWAVNLYDLNARTFLLKFNRSGGATESGEGEKVNVLLESGVRFHSTSFMRERKVGPDKPGGGGLLHTDTATARHVLACQCTQ